MTDSAEPAAESRRRWDELSSKQEIRDNLLVYCRGIDRCQVELVRSAFWPDAFDNHGALAAPAWQFATEIIESKLAHTTLTVHSVTNHLVEVEGDLAFSEAIIVSYQKHAGNDDVQIFCGRYVDRVERRDGRWRIAYRNLVHDWSGSLAVGGTWNLPSVDAKAFIQGGRQESDLVTGPGRAQMLSPNYPPPTGA